MHYNRRQRRQLAKDLGLLGKQESHQQWLERTRRSREAGEQIHMQFLAENEARLREAAAEREGRQLESLTEKFGEERAKEIMENNNKNAQARQAKRNLAKAQTLTMAQAIVADQKMQAEVNRLKSIERYKRASKRHRAETAEKNERIKILRTAKKQK